VGGGRREEEEEGNRGFPFFGMKRKFEMSYLMVLWSSIWVEEG
jgi:hypothetical protein